MEQPTLPATPTREQMIEQTTAYWLRQDAVRRWIARGDGSEEKARQRQERLVFSILEEEYRRFVDPAYESSSSGGSGGDNSSMRSSSA